MRQTPPSFQQGWIWFVDACRVLKQDVFAFTGMVMFYYAVMIVLNMLPFFGTIASGVWMPFGAVLLGFATRDLLAQKKVSFEPLLALARKPVLRTTLLNLGLFYALGTQLIVIAFLYLGQDTMKQITQAMENDSLNISISIPWAAIVVAVLIFIPLTLSTLFAPLLVADGGKGVKKALFHSLMGIVLNWKACLGALLVFTAISLGGLLGIDVLFALVGLAHFDRFYIPILMMLVTSVGQAMIWPMYRDIFHEKGFFVSAK